MSGRPSLQLLLVGAGRVGRRLLRLLGDPPAPLPFDWTLVGVCSRSRGGALDPAGLDYGRWLDAHHAGDVARHPLPGDGRSFLEMALPPLASACLAGRVVVVETTILDPERGEPATTHVRRALDAGAHVVTANKGPAAFAWSDLQARAARAGRRFLCESAVMDGVPVFSLVADALPAIRVTAFRGVVNTTCGYILDALASGRSFEDAVAEMQAQGIAEADPSLDIDGWDAAAKAAALANALLDAAVTPHDVRRTGIRGVDAAAVREGAAAGRQLRLVAQGRRTAAGGEVAVEPQWLDARDPLAQVSGLENVLYLTTEPLGTIGIVQRDGGLDQTAYGLLADLARVSRALRL